MPGTAGAEPGGRGGQTRGATSRRIGRASKRRAPAYGTQRGSAIDRLDHRAPLEDHRQRLLQLGARHVGADAVMDPEAEPEVPVLAPGDVEAVGVAELAGITVRRRHRQRDVGTRGHGHAGDLEVDGRDARDAADDRFVAHDLLDGHRHELGVRTQEVELVGVGREQVQDDREGAARGVVASEEEVDQQRLQLGPAEPVARLLGVDERAEQVVGRVGPPAVDELRRERVEVGDRTLDLDEEIGREVRREREPDGDRPLLDDGLVVGRDAEHLAQHGEREHVAQPVEHVGGVIAARRPDRRGARG